MCLYDPADVRTISGVRKNTEVLAWIDTHLAASDGHSFWRSQNDVLLSKALPPKYIRCIETWPHRARVSVALHVLHHYDGLETCDCDGVFEANYLQVVCGDVVHVEVLHEKGHVYNRFETYAYARRGPLEGWLPTALLGGRVGNPPPFAASLLLHQTSHLWACPTHSMEPLSLGTGTHVCKWKMMSMVLEDDVNADQCVYSFVAYGRNNAPGNLSHKIFYKGFYIRGPGKCREGVL